MTSRQRGLTLSGFLLWSVALILVLLLGFRIGPAYYEYFVIQKQLRAIAEDPVAATGSRGEIEAAFLRRATVENIRVVEPRDLRISKRDNGIEISASYSVRVHLFRNLSACLDFEPSSAK